MTLAIRTEHASFTYLNADHPYLQDINLKVSAGECVLICGKSGSGKTTFSRLLNGISPDYIEGELSGDVYTTHLEAGHAPIEDYVPVVGSVFQNPKTQHFTINTTTELAFPAENMGIDPQVIKRRIKQVSRDFKTEYLLDRDIFKLSGGEKQQIALLSAAMLQPQVIILDEVSSNLDDNAILKTHALIEQFKACGVTILLTEHRLAWTKGLVDRYLLFDQGQLVRDWPAESFLALSNEELHTLGLRSLILDAHYQRLQAKNKPATTKNMAATLTTHELVTGYGEQSTSQILNFAFNKGEITGLLGPNGVGKSTLASTLTGLIKPVSGQIMWNGQPMTTKELIKKSYLVMQDTNYQLFSDSVEGEVLLGAKYPEHKDGVLHALNLDGLKERHPMSLSGGQKQRVAIASAMLSGKELIIFDEPTSGLDYENMQKFGHLLNHIKEKTKAIVIVITHDIELAADWCDSVIRLNKP